MVATRHTIEVRGSQLHEAIYRVASTSKDDKKYPDHLAAYKVAESRYRDAVVSFGTGREMRLL